MSVGAAIGRKDEQAQLSRALDAARAGRTQVVLLHGEPGIGKTTLVEAAAALAAQREMAVGWGRCWEAGGAPPFWPWIQLLRTLRKLAPELPPQVSRLLPEVGGLDPHLSSPEDRFLLFDGVVRHVAAAASAKPLLLALEDLHAADPASLQLLEFAAAHLRDAPAVLLATFRDLEVRLAPATDALLDRVARNGLSIALGPLRKDEVAALLATGPSGADDATAAWLHETTKGNPLFLREMLHVLVQGARSGERPPVPEGVRAAIREHLRAVPPPLAEPLAVAAAIGREFRPALVAEVAGLSPQDAQERLEAAVRIGVLVERGQGRFAFAHALIAETLHLDLPATRRAGLHLKIASALEASRSPESLPEIARHLFAAGPEAAQRAVAAARAAADRSLKQLAFEQAESLLSRALESATGPAERLEILLALGEARMSAGDDEEGRAACREAAALAKAQGSPELLARAALAYGFAFTFGQTDPLLVDLIEESLRALPPGDSALRARLLARLGAALQPAADPRKPVALAREAVAMARALGDERTRLQVFHAASAAFARFVPVAERLAIDQEALEIATRLDAPAFALRARARLAFDAWDLGQPGAAGQHAEAYEALARGFRQPRFGWLVPMFHAMRALFEGRFDEEERKIAETEALIADLDDDLPQACLATHALLSQRTRGDDANLPEGLRRMSAWAPSGAYFTTASAMVAARGGRLAEARAGLARLPFDILPEVHDTMLYLWAAEVAVLCGDREAAARLYPALLPHADENVVVYVHGMAVDGPVSRGLFLLAALLGRAGDARLHAEHALALMRAQGGRPHQARVLLEMAQALGGSEAAGWLKEAEAIALELRMPLLDQVRAARGRLAAPSLRLVREGDFWSVNGPSGVVRLRHTRGLEMLARLVAEPGREVRALELAGGEDTGDAGEVIDAEARDAYRGRLRELEEELQQAEQWNDPARAEALREEAEALRDELSRAVGMGGRSRRAGSSQERARINVQRRISDAIRKIAESNPELGEHLASCVKTGAWCSYSPERARR